MLFYAVLAVLVVLLVSACGYGLTALARRDRSDNAALLDHVEHW